MSATLSRHRVVARIVEMPAQTMAVVRTVGDPNIVAAPAIRALYASVGALRGRRNGAAAVPLRARWPDAHLRPRARWTAEWALPVPDDVTAVPQVDERDHPVVVERWPYGTMAETLHVGAFSGEPATLARMQESIADQGYEVIGPHEEEYLTPPGSPDQRTAIRYPVRPSVPAHLRA